MPRPRRPWFRVYVEMVHDGKLRFRPPAERWLWVCVLAIARESQVPGELRVGMRRATVEQIADVASLPVPVVEEGIAYFLSKDVAMLRRTSAKVLVVAHWETRQFDSDDVAVRTAKHRSNVRGRNVPTTFPGTPPESESDTELKKRSSPLPSPFESGFAEVWDRYPRKESRKAALRAYTARRRQGVPAGELAAAVANYAKAVASTERQFVKLGSTFFGPDEHWRDYASGVPAASEAPTDQVQFLPGTAYA